mmetsp:Transcript_11027/g.12962  ORF Transcript_11027/g.12962 Transcript_11027/m.12962 type:complete len:109 (-) Transcript_11027:431-757(-)
MAKSTSLETKLIVHGDLISQPVRAVLGFCHHTGISFEFKALNVFRGGTHTAEYKQIHPMEQIPAIQEITGGEVFNLGESHTIMRYLAETRQVADHWYPREPKARAVVN